MYVYDKTYIRRGKMGHLNFVFSLALLTFDSAARRRTSQARLNNSGCPILLCRISVYYLIFQNAIDMLCRDRSVTSQKLL